MENKQKNIGRLQLCRLCKFLKESIVAPMLKSFLLSTVLLLFCVMILSCVHSRGSYYRIRKGDTLYRISKRYKVNVERLIVMNEIKDPSDLKVGKVIYIPSTPQGITPVYEPAKGKKRAKRIKKYKPVKIPGGMHFAWPIKGKILTSFGRSGKHRYDGINIEGNWGEEVRASSGGQVVYSGSGVKGYGNMVILKHEKRIYSIYALNSENLVSKGDNVRTSQVIAKVGGIPRIGKSFLHFQMRAGKRAINPLDVLK